MFTVTARRLIAAFLLGAAVGAASTVPYYGRRVEALILTTGSLLQQLHEHRARLERLQEAGNEPSRRVIQRVRLEFLYPDEAVRLSLTERLAPLAEELVGRELERVDPYLVHALFDGRAVDLDEARYQVTVRSVVAAEEVTVILAVARVVPGPGPGASRGPGGSAAGPRQWAPRARREPGTGASRGSARARARQRAPGASRHHPPPAAVRARRAPSGRAGGVPFGRGRAAHTGRAEGAASIRAGRRARRVSGRGTGVAAPPGPAGGDPTAGR